MPDAFRSALARTQSDYDFYVRCQTDPDSALAEYDLTAEQRSALTNPEMLADSLRSGRIMKLPPITIKISGSHDWVNVAQPKGPDQTSEMIARAVEAVRRAVGSDARDASTLALVRLVG